MEGTPSERAAALGWAVAETPESRRGLIRQTKAVVVVLCLHVVAFQILASVPSFTGYEMSGVAGVFFLFFAVLYLALGIAVGLDWRGGMYLGFVLAPVTILFWALALGVGQWGIGGLPRSGWLLALSIVESLGIVLGLVILQQVGRSFRTPAAE